MPKTGMEPIRRAEAINAALECICEYGIDQITLEMVAERAGFSKGIVAYYFKTKKQLLLESLKAFLSSYQRKIVASLSPEMQPQQMVQRVVEVSLPPLNEEAPGKLNVSDLAGAEQICLPEQKIARLFIQFVSKAATDEDLMAAMRSSYASDVMGIARLLKLARQSAPGANPDEREAAYALLAMIYGLSFFRVTNFYPTGKEDNRQIATEFIHRWLGIHPTTTGEDL
jgi:TetR/AcrR family transcriptional repressor of bet genes